MFVNLFQCGRGPLIGPPPTQPRINFPSPSLPFPLWIFFTSLMAEKSFCRFRDLPWVIRGKTCLTCASSALIKPDLWRGVSSPLLLTYIFLLGIRACCPLPPPPLILPPTLRIYVSEIGKWGKRRRIPNDYGKDKRRASPHFFFRRGLADNIWECVYCMCK